MTLAMGANAFLRIKAESTYGIAATGDYINVPLADDSLVATQRLSSDQLLGAGRSPQVTVKEELNVEGSIIVPVDLNNFGLWLWGLMGPPTTTGDGTPYVHTFNNGALDSVLPSFSMELSHTDIAKYRMRTGCKVNSLQFSFTRTGAARSTVTLIAKDENILGTTGAGTPTSLAFTQFSGFNATAKVGGVAFAKCTSAEFTLANNLEKSEELTGDGLIASADATQNSTTGTINLRFADTTYIDLAKAGTPIELEFAYALDSERSIAFTIWQAKLELPGIEVKGPGGISIPFSFIAERDDSTGIAFTVVLTNTTAGTVYGGA